MNLPLGPRFGGPETHPEGWSAAIVRAGGRCTCRPFWRSARAAGTVQRNDVDPNAARPSSAEPGWTWPPYAPIEPDAEGGFRLDEWAPPSSVRHPWVRVGRWTLLYRRSA